MMAYPSGVVWRTPARARAIYAELASLGFRAVLDIEFDIIWWCRCSLPA